MATEKEIGDVLTGILRRSEEELLALTEEELPRRWYFTYEPHGSVAWNIYQFSGAMESYR